MEIIHQLIEAFNKSKTITVYLKNGTVYDKCQVVSNEIIMGKKAKQSYTTVLKDGDKHQIDLKDIEKIV